jgi:crotonobetainyl-CoA:carnitine CoA-transferase CaiB-like acyl-CoA transferase
MADMERPLSDATVLELGHIVAGPYCSLLLADLGAEVVKIEGPEGGDVIRDSSPGASGIFNFMNRNKQSVTVNLKDEEGIEVFEDLVAEADVLIENYSPGTVDRLGIGYEDMREVNPELVYCSIKGFNEGPYQHRPALDPVAEALSGLMTTTGYPGQPPTRCGTSIADMAASFHGAIAILGALRQRDAGQGGQHITAPMFEATAGLMGGHIAFSDMYGEPAKPMKGGSQQLWAPYGVFQTGDDEWVFVGPSSQGHWESLCDVMGFDGLLADERFETLAKRREHQDELDELLSDAFAGFTQQEVVDRLEAGNVPVAPVQDTVEVADDPHLKETGSLVEVNAAEGNEGAVRVPSSPLRSTGFELPPAEDPPALGEDTEAYLQQFGYSEERIEELRERGAI